MIKTVQKRNGELVAYDSSKIKNAIQRANGQIDYYLQISDKQVDELVSDVEQNLRNDCPTVEEIQDTVINCIIKRNYSELAKVYIVYRHDKSKVRDIS